MNPLGGKINRSEPFWWRSPDLRGELEAILGLVNESRRETGLDEERAARKLLAVRDAAAVMHRARCARAAVAGNPSIRVPQLFTNGFLGSVMHR